MATLHWNAWVLTWALATITPRRQTRSYLPLGPPKQHGQFFDTSEHALTHRSNFFFGPLGLFAFGTATLPQESFASYGNAGTPSVDTIQYFWSVNRSSSDPSTWVANPGHETIPPDWYNRPTALSFAEIFAETSQLYAEAGYPAFGGNVGKTDSFVGLDFEAGGIENGILKDPSAEGIACLFQQVLVDGKCFMFIPLFSSRPLDRTQE